MIKSPGQRPTSIPFTIGAKDYDVPVPMVLLCLKHAWPFIDAVRLAGDVIETAEAICGAVAAGMMLGEHKPSLYELTATLTAPQIPALMVSFGRLMEHCGLEMTSPGEAQMGEGLAAGTADPIGTTSSPSSPPTDSKAAVSTASRAA